MSAAAKQTPLFPAALLASVGVTDLSKMVTQSFESLPQLGKRTITYRENTTVYFDDFDAKERLVLRLTVETKKRGGKRVPLPDSFPSLQVSKLVGYDADKNTWGSESHTTDYFPDPDLAIAWEAHQQLESIRATMKQDGPYNWYPNAV